LPLITDGKGLNSGVGDVVLQLVGLYSQLLVGFKLLL